jgi:NADH dehydrogenase [ubiquinone] 1 alpha subcomplex assembly factor 6
MLHKMSLFRHAASRRLYGTTSAHDTTDIKAALRHCLTVIRARDHDAYLACIHGLSTNQLPRVVPIHALNCETASVISSTANMSVAIVKLQWWRQVVDSMFNESKSQGVKAAEEAHPVVLALKTVLDQSGRTVHLQRLLRRMIEARIWDASFDGQGVDDLMAMEKYASDARGSALCATLEVNGIRNTDCDHAASHLGKAIGLAALLRGTVAHAKQRRCYLPRESCAREGVSIESVYRLEQSEGVKNVAHEVATVAKSHLDSARAMEGRIPREARVFLLQATPVGRYLDALEAKDFDIFDETVSKGGVPLITQGHMAWNAYRGTY